MTHEEYCKRLKELDKSDFVGRIRLNEQRNKEEIDEQYPKVMKECVNALIKIEKQVKGDNER